MRNYGVLGSHAARRGLDGGMHRVWHEISPSAHLHGGGHHLRSGSLLPALPTVPAGSDSRPVSGCCGGGSLCRGGMRRPGLRRAVPREW